MNTLNEKLNNKFVPNINTRATRTVDAQIDLGILSVQFKDRKVKMIIDSAYREINKQEVADIERILGKFVGTDISQKSLSDLMVDLMPVATKLSTNI